MHEGTGHRSRSCRLSPMMSFPHNLHEGDQRPSQVRFHSPLPLVSSLPHLMMHTNGIRSSKPTAVILDSVRMLTNAANRSTMATLRAEQARRYFSTIALPNHLPLLVRLEATPAMDKGTDQTYDHGHGVDLQHQVWYPVFKE